MDGVARQIDTLSPQHHAQLPRTPIRITLPHLDHTLFQSCRRALRAGQRPAAVLRNPLHTLLLVPVQPQISGRTRNTELLAQGTKRLRPSLRCGYKLHSLFMNVHTPPRHPLPPALETRWSVKDVPGRSVKDVMGLNILRVRVLPCPTPPTFLVFIPSAEAGVPI